MAGRKNRGMHRLIYDRARQTGCSPFEAIDQIVDEMKSFRLGVFAGEPEAFHPQWKEVERRLATAAGRAAALRCSDARSCGQLSEP